MGLHVPVLTRVDFWCKPEIPSPTATTANNPMLGAIIWNGWNQGSRPFSACVRAGNLDLPPPRWVRSPLCCSVEFMLSLAQCVCNLSKGEQLQQNRQIPCTSKIQNRLVARGLKFKCLDSSRNMIWTLGLHALSVDPKYQLFPGAWGLYLCLLVLCFVLLFLLFNKSLASSCSSEGNFLQNGKTSA